MAKLYGYMVCVLECITTLPIIMYNYYAPIKTWRTKKEKYGQKRKKRSQLDSELQNGNDISITFATSVLNMGV